ncbi:hypothetical protein P691DRAFT_739224 [Macrolepiota fuliginosa MF-IS2]|uniref:CRAL/TRIO N-terminal domain-containing protein n=1 Tax=Macrolepiota fuliginosa MF-IS2 TaxID=1400762 RepID=A0A9P6BY49_9AGAR|nr:hypothetical protein P691DRAFT_739224 [Macrolepiota fuliginosa MF-IS2]
MTTQRKVYTLRPPPDALYQHDQLPPFETIKSEVYTQVHFHFEDSLYQLPGETPILGVLTDNEKFWLPRDCILRFLKSTKWDPTATIKRIQATLKWRRDRRIYSFPDAPGVETEAKTGKGILFGYDTQGRPSLHLMPSKIHAKDEAAQLEFSIFMLERCIALMPPGVQTLNILMNYEECTKQPVISHTRRLLEVLEIHYPGRLKYVVAANVSIFRRPITKSVLVLTNGPKCKLNPDIFEEGLYRPEEMMKQGWGGAIYFTYEYDKYWPELIRFTDQRQKLRKAKWKQLSGTVGIREWDYKRRSFRKRQRSELSSPSLKPPRLRHTRLRFASPGQALVMNCLGVYHRWPSQGMALMDTMAEEDTEAMVGEEDMEVTAEEVEEAMAVEAGVSIFFCRQHPCTIYHLNKFPPPCETQPRSPHTSNVILVNPFNSHPSCPSIAPSPLHSQSPFTFSKFYTTFSTNY